MTLITYYPLSREKGVTKFAYESPTRTPYHGCMVYSLTGGSFKKYRSEEYTRDYSPTLVCKWNF